MKKFAALWAFTTAFVFSPCGRATVLTSIPGPDDQGALQGNGTVGMIMPMVMLSGNTLSLMFMPPYSPLMASLEFWSPGDTFDPTAAWYDELDPVGGDGDLFNNQYGFTFMGSIPEGKAIGIRLTSVSSDQLQFWNYVNSQNRFDEVFQDVNSQVLWNGSMWHNYVTLPSDALAGAYTATFEVFIADATFTAGTGFADYSASALSATEDSNYNTVTITYTWTVVPEPSTYLLLAGGLVFLAAAGWRKRHAIRA